MAVTSCQPGSKESADVITVSKDMTASQNIKPTESGYADVNGLKIYYEVYGNGKPIVLLHGSFITIPMNWSHIIPLLAKDRKIIVAEMQGHDRTRDIPRDISYEGMADAGGNLRQPPQRCLLTAALQMYRSDMDA